MKKENISEIISGIDDSYIQESTVYTKKRHTLRYAAVAASVAVVVITALGFAHFSDGIFTPPSPTSANGEENASDVKNQQELDTAPAIGSPENEMSISPQWTDMITSQKFGEFTLDSVRYSTQVTEISENHIGQYIRDTAFSGYDIYEDKTYETKGGIYEIKDISPECALAVKFNGEESFHVYVNAEYAPDTLGQFIDDLNMRSTVSFGKAYSDKTENREYTSIIYADFDDSIVWDMLLSDTNVKNISYDRFYDKIAGISVDIPLLGYENVSLGVTKDGYIITNILNTQKCFFIGKEKAEAFGEYLQENVPFKENVTVFENPDGTIPGKGDSGESVPGYNPDAPETVSPPYDPSSGNPPPSAGTSSVTPVPDDMIVEETTKS